MADSKLTYEEAAGMTYTDEVVVEKVVDLPVSVAFERFREIVWLKNAGMTPASWTKIVAEGADTETHVGEVRLAAGLMYEKILKTIPNEEIFYSVVGGPFPVNNHLGSVKFVAEGENKTRIVWTVKFTPKFGMGLVVKGVVKATFPFFLSKV